MKIERHTANGWWIEEAGEAPLAAPLEGSVDADVVVIGGGYTGLWTAWHLLRAEPEARVVLLEAGRCGHGPSGRNGGFCESLWLSAAALRERFGDEPALRLLEASSESVSAIGAWCAEQEVDAWFDQSGYLCVSTAPAHDEVGHASVAAAAALGAPARVQALDAEQARARCDSTTFRGGVSIPDFATVQPARLALGLRRRVAERGVQVFEQSPVRALRVRRAHERDRGATEQTGGLRAAREGEHGGRGGRGGRDVVVETDRGRVRAAAAVLAVGGAARGIRPLRSRLSVTSSHIVLTEPVPDVLDEIGWTGGECITDGRLLVHYFRTTRDGRIAFGRGGGRIAYGARLGGRIELDGDAVETAAAHLLRLFPQLRGRRLTHAWGGPIDVSPSHLPQVGTLPGAPVSFALGYTGNGVGPSQLAGRVLASLALDRRDEVTRLPIVDADAGAWVPPEPVAWLGGELVRAALLRGEAADDAGRTPDPLTRALIALPRRMGVHIAR
jgi:glycine/D-amino acid oxidase-like deaminating enzyme